MTLAAGATVTGMLAMNSDEQVAAAEQTVCAYEKTILITAVEADRLMDTDLAYATPAGTDGMDELRTSGFLQTSSNYWRYTGLDELGRPQLELQHPIEGCD